MLLERVCWIVTFSNKISNGALPRGFSIGLKPALSPHFVGSHIMIQRRIDERSALATEYALFLVETRGVSAGLVYLESCNVSQEILLRAMQDPAARRSRERRQRQRND
jgi:hypothetical protein